MLITLFACFSIWAAIWRPKWLAKRWLQNRWFETGKPATRWATASGNVFYLCIGVLLINSYAQLIGQEHYWIFALAGGVGFVGAVIIDL